MKNLLFIIPTFLFINLAILVNAQEEIEVNSSILQEKIILFTDRSMYSVDEYIYFKANYLTNKYLDNAWSTVLYIELIQPNGNPIVQAKFPLSKSGAAGKIHIPNEVLTGVYFIKVYTKWMRNYPTNTYAYHKLILINPNNSNIALIDESPDTNNIIRPNSFSRNKLDVEIIINKPTYSPKEKVTVSITPNKYNLKEKEYCISVIKKGTKAIYDYNSPNFVYQIPEFDRAIYYPEINGITLSGKILNNKTHQAEVNASVNIAYLNKNSYFSGFYTNNSGEFFFNFPYMEGKQEFFINTAKTDLRLNIEIDEDFCSKPVLLNPVNFKLSDNERKIANEVSINAQITKVFKDSLTIDTSNTSTNQYHSFYGTPNKKIYTKDYINLPNIEEFIFELVEDIRIKYKKQKPSILCNKNHTLSVYPFLVMIDNLPISDLSAFLDIELNKIERFEIIDNGYVIANLKYSGIINAITKEKNLAGINLPQNSMFFRYKMFYYKEKKSTQNKSQYLQSRVPDRRNCLYWNPSFQIAQQSINSFSFYTADIKGEYEIIIQSVSKNDGKILTAEKSFIVE